MPIKVTEQFKLAWGKETPSFDDLMALDGEMYRQVARRRTFKFTLKNKDYFAKIHKGVGWGEIAKNLLQGRLPVLGAVNEFDAIKALTALGIKTMTLVAYGQRGDNLAELESFVITESLEPALSLEDLSMDWASNKPNLRLKRALIKCVATITRQLHDNGINHRDLYICHFLLKESDLESVQQVEELPLYLIDLHRVQMRKEVPERWRVKDLAALYFSSMGIGFTKRDFYRFIQVYSDKSLSAELKSNESRWAKVFAKGQKLNLKPIKD
ncbi:MAG: lipopolysaccharide kinase [Cycloclasticus sp. symbiont of Poecilosclerida sp. M]|nr:MAG: lipopolysaccharide kinase [Cycloclasticus sp. symbiont of Poecilosclerida sp. M]